MPEKLRDEFKMILIKASKERPENEIVDAGYADLKEACGLVARHIEHGLIPQLEDIEQ